MSNSWDPDQAWTTWIQIYKLFAQKISTVFFFFHLKVFWRQSFVTVMIDAPLYLNFAFSFERRLKRSDKQNSTFALMRDISLQIKKVIYIGQKQFPSPT